MNSLVAYLEYGRNVFESYLTKTPPFQDVSVALRLTKEVENDSDNKCNSQNTAKDCSNNNAVFIRST